MDIQEKQAFEAEFEKTDFYKMNLVNCFCFITDRYVWDEVQAAWEMWKAATARMEIRINTLDEMLLNQGEALAQAKAKAVPEWISTSERMPDHGEFVLILAPACEGTMFVGIRDEEDDNFWYDPTDMSYLELKYAPSWMPLPDAPQGPAND